MELPSFNISQAVWCAVLERRAAPVHKRNCFPISIRKALRRDGRTNHGTIMELCNTAPSRPGTGTEAVVDHRACSIEVQQPDRT